MQFQSVRFFQAHLRRCLFLLVMFCTPTLSWATAYTGTLTCAASNYTLDVPALGVNNVTSTGQAGFGVSPTLNTMSVGDTLTINTTGCTYTSSLVKTFWNATFANDVLSITATASSYNMILNSSLFSFNIGLSSMPTDYLRITFSGFTAGDPTPTLTFATPTSASVALQSTLSNVATSTVTTAGAGQITYSSSDTNVATVDSSGLVTGVSVGSATITATQAAVSGINAAATQTYSVTVTLAQQATLSIAGATTMTRVSGGYNLTTSGGSGNGAVTYAVTSGSCTISSGGIWAGGSIETCRITATKAAEGIYAAATAIKDISVVAEPTPTLTFSTPTSATITLLGTLTNAVTSTASGTVAYPVGAITYSSSNTSVATVDSTNGQITPVAAGTATITASQARGPGANSAATQTYTLTVTLVPQATFTVTASSTSIVQGGSSTTLSTSGGTGSGTVTYAITSGQSSCTLSGNTVTSTSTLGTCRITATKAAYAVYDAATATVDIGVGNAPTPTLTFATPNSLALTMGQTATNAVTSTITGGGSGAISYASSNTSIATVNSSTGQVTPVAAGTATITATQASSAGVNMQATQTYTLTVSLATQATLVASASPSTILASTGTSTLSTTGGSGNGVVTYAVTTGVSSCTLSGSTITATSTVGTCVITATKAAQGNYDAATATVTITVNNLIAQATLNVAASPSAISKNTGTSTLSTTGGSGSGAVTYAVTGGTCTVSGTTLTAGSVAETCTVTATKAADSTYSAITATTNITVNNRASISDAVNRSVAGTIAAQSTAAQRFADAQVNNISSHIQGLRNSFNVKANRVAIGVNSLEFSQTSQILEKLSETIAAQSNQALVIEEPKKPSYSIEVVESLIQALNNARNSGEVTQVLTLYATVDHSKVKASLLGLKAGQGESKIISIRTLGENELIVRVERSWMGGKAIVPVAIQINKDGQYELRYSEVELLKTMQANNKDLYGASGKPVKVKAVAGVQLAQKNTPSSSGQSVNHELFGNTPVGVWASGTLDYGTLGISGGSNKFSSQGLTFGIDFQVQKNLIIGAALGYGFDKTDVDTLGTNVKSNQVSFATYGVYQPIKDWFVDGLLGYSNITMNNNRYSSASSTIFSADRKGQTVYGSFGLGNIFTFEEIKFQPYARVNHMSTTLNSYSEGTDANALAYNRAKLISESISAGLIASQDFSVEGGKITPSAKFELKRNARGSLNQGIYYADTPAESTVLSMTAAPLNVQSFGLGVIYTEKRSGASAGLSWQGSLGTNSYRANAFKADVRVPF